MKVKDKGFQMVNKNEGKKKKKKEEFYMVLRTSVARIVYSVKFIYVLCF